MREIIFRGKRKDNGKWIVGNLIHQLDYYGTPCDRYFMTGKHDCVDYDIGEPVEIIPETVGQYTGLKDKNGKMIFEGDIVIHNNTHYTVEFSRTQLGFVCMDRNHKTRGGWPNWRDGQWMQNVSKYLEVISTIHDQKEDV